jgi:hypothetical protein
LWQNVVAMPQHATNRPQLPHTVATNDVKLSLLKTQILPLASLIIRIG